MLSWVAARSRMAAGRGDWWEALWRGWCRCPQGVCGVGRACVQNGAGRSGSQGIDGGRVSRCSMSAGSAQRRVGCLSNWALGFWRGSEHSADDCLRFANPPLRSILHSYWPDTRTVLSTHLGPDHILYQLRRLGTGQRRGGLLSPRGGKPSELDRENAWTRIHLTALLVAEGDRDEYRRTEASRAREAAIMEHVQGWKVRKWNEQGCGGR